MNLRRLCVTRERAHSRSRRHCRGSSSRRCPSGWCSTRRCSSWSCPGCLQGVTPVGTTRPVHATTSRKHALRPRIQLRPTQAPPADGYGFICSASSWFSERAVAAQRSGRSQLLRGGGRTWYRLDALVRAHHVIVAALAFAALPAAVLGCADGTCVRTRDNMTPRGSRSLHGAKTGLPGSCITAASVDLDRARSSQIAT